MNLSEILKKLKKKEITPEQAKALIQEIQLDDHKSIIPVDTADDYVIEVISRVLKFRKEQLHPNMELSDIGIESNQAVALVAEFEKDLGPLSKTLLFEFHTIRDLSNYFLENHREKTPFSNRLSIPHPNKSIEVKKVFKEEKNERLAYPDDAIAIIGISGSYPKSPNLEIFWENLKEGFNAIEQIPIDRWDYRKHFDLQKRKKNKSYSKFGGFLLGVEEFDSALFNIAPIDVYDIDPQERKFLEIAWETLEDAGYTRQTLTQKYNSEVSVYVGVMYNDYPLLRQEDRELLSCVSADLANRVSYFFNFCGPSLSINTMCSSSLVSIALGCQSIQRGECRLSLAGGVNLTLHQNKYISLSKENMLSSDGFCRSFGKGGDGYVPSEGVGAVLLKSLKEAIRDRDHIYAVVRSCEVNNCGKSMAYRVPNAESQAEIIRKALKKAKVTAKDFTYIEAHGTGTAIGDPIEIEGLTKVFSDLDAEPQSIPVGSVKSNIGHCESASGIAGVTKVLLQMKHKTLVPSIHSEELNSNIEFEKTPFFVQRELKSWKGPKIVGISSFGAGGVNAHLILEGFEREENAIERKFPLCFQLVTLSAASFEQLRVHAEKILNFLLKESYNPRSKNLNVDYQDMKRIFADICKFPIDDFEISLPIEDLGLDLSMQMQLLEKIQKSLKPDFTLKNLQKCQTIKDVAEAVAQEKKEVSFKEKEFLASLTYTLQTGRTGMKHRVALICEDLDSLKKSLQKFLNDQTSENIFYGQAKKGNLEFSSSTSDIKQIAGSWIGGEEIDWESLWGSKIPLKMPLPKYPFKRKKFPLRKEENRKELEEKDLFSHTVFSTFEWIEKKNFENSTQIKQDCRKILIIPEKIQNEFKGETYLLSNEGEDAGSIYDNFSHLFLYLQKLIKEERCKEFSLILLITPELEWKFSPFLGLFRSLNQENPKYIGKVVVLPDFSKESIEKFKEKMDQEWFFQGSHVLYNESGKRYVQKLKAIPFDPDSEKYPLLKEGGVYWITGGKGGLGKLFAEYFATKKISATLVLTGRSQIDSKEREYLKGFGEPSLNIDYLSCDVSDRESVKDLVSKIVSKYGKITGIIHSAGVLRDSFFLNKSLEQVHQVFQPKIWGGINIDEATKEIPLDYFLLFSSEASLYGNIGQTDYAAANAFLDFFPDFRRKRGRNGVCKAINWPLWEKGGMQVPDSVVNMIKNTTGMIPLTTEVGTRSLEYILAMPYSQVFVSEGNIEKIREVFQMTGVVERPSEKTHNLQTQVSNDQISEKLVDSISLYLKWDKNQIDKDSSFQDFGIDSVRAIEFAEILNKKFGIDISPTEFFQYSSINEFIQFLISQKKEMYTNEKIDVTDVSEEIYQHLMEMLDLSISEIDTQLSFQDLGMDSVKLSEFAHLLNEKYETEVSPTQFFEYSSIKNFVNYFASLIKQKTEVEQEKVYSHHPRQNENEPIAVIGMAGRFPMSENLDEFWHNLESGKDLIQEIKKERPNWKSLFQSSDSALKWGGFIDDIAAFDADFFHLSPREAELMDPQHRIMLQTVWHAIEDAGIKPENLAKTKTAVFIGVSTGDYGDVIAQAKAESSPYFSTGNSHAILANRISYLLDLMGPSEPVDTACSSALVAIHRAVMSLRTKVASMAIVGGVNVILHHTLTEGFRMSGMLSDDGRCKSFDEKANGYVRGEGSGAVILKPLSVAIADKDPIYAVIKGVSINHGGKTSSLTAPSTSAQRDLLLEAYRDARVDFETVGYIETHGTGTSLGDPIEFNAIKQVWEKSSNSEKAHLSKCALGAVKTNVGHLESAAGIVGFIKTVLILTTKKIPLNLHFQTLNPHIKIGDTPFYFPQKTKTWFPLHDKHDLPIPRRAGVSSFGYGGVNAHVVLEEFLEAPKKEKKKAFPLFILSAKNKEQLLKQIENFLHFLKRDLLDSDRFSRFLFTLQVGRNEMRVRLAIVAENQQDLIKNLEGFLEMPASSEEVFSNMTGLISFHPTSKIQKVAKDWVEQKEIDWRKENDFYAFYRLHLPLYPFAKDHHWVGQSFTKEVLEKEEAFSGSGFFKFTKVGA